MKPIIDVCCGSKMFYFNKDDEHVLFCDNRSVSDILCDGRKLEIAPNIKIDFRDLSVFKDDTFSLVVFDPPALIKSFR